MATQPRPDMILIDAESEVRDSLEHVVMATRYARGPIVLFANNNDNDKDTSHVKDAVAAGVSA